MTANTKCNWCQGKLQYPQIFMARSNVVPTTTVSYDHFFDTMYGGVVLTLFSSCGSRARPWNQV
eukprot:9617059-Karenia_brevis.AAC.1